MIGRLITALRFSLLFYPLNHIEKIATGNGKDYSPDSQA